MNDKILFLTNKGGNYGSGHFNRINLLKKHLEQMNISGVVAIGNHFSPSQEIASYKIVLLDSRDDEFPTAVISQKKEYHHFIAIDNRGHGRNQCDLIWDTLPHMDMSETELKSSLKNCILDPAIYECNPMPAKSKIFRTTLENIESNSKIDLIQYTANNKERIDETQFRKKLMASDKVGAYYGQTFFEALYLGKEIYLYDISDYHKRLSDWFTIVWNKQTDLNEAFDGQGLHRLAVLIRSILSGDLFLQKN